MRGKSRQGRGSEGEVRTVVGTHAIREAFRVSRTRCLRLCLDRDWKKNQDLKEFHEKASQAGLSIEICTDVQLRNFAPSHQGGALLVRGAPSWDWDLLASRQRSVLVVLDEIEDPHNLGAILRTGWLMGIDGIGVPAHRSAGLSPSVHKVACGGVEHVPVEVWGHFAQPLERLKEMGFWILGLSEPSTGGKFFQTLPQKIIPPKVVWVVGSEERGLRSTTRKLCEELVSIPQGGIGQACYNASVAVAMALYETSRQQWKDHQG